MDHDEPAGGGAGCWFIFAFRVLLTMFLTGPLKKKKITITSCPSVGVKPEFSKRVTDAQASASLAAAARHSAWSKEELAAGCSHLEL